MSDAPRDRIRTDAIEHAAQAAWEHDHPQTPWEQAPESVRAPMRALVTPTVYAVLIYLDDRDLLDLKPQPDTFPEGITFERAVSRAYSAAHLHGVTVGYVYKGVPVLAHPSDSWQDVAGRYAEAAEDAAR